MLASKASGTSENYLRAFNRWKTFARDVLGTSDFPVRSIDCALYLQHLLESSKSVSAINCAFYAFRWANLLAGLDSPTLHPTVIAVKEGAINIEKSKTDQLRKGRSVVIAESCSDTCPCTLLKLYMQHSGFGFTCPAVAPVGCRCIFIHCCILLCQ